MDSSSYRPQSPDLSSFTTAQDHASYVPRSPDLSGIPSQVDLADTLPSPRYGHYHSLSRDRFGNLLQQPPFTQQHGSPTSVPTQLAYPSTYDMAPTTRRMTKTEIVDDDYLPDAPLQTFKQELTTSRHPPMMDTSTQSPPDPTLGVKLKTSFPVARIKRIMQADDDIGKVAQVTPHVVSRALELFMIKIISASAQQAAQTGGGSGKGPKRVLAQHVKRALQADESFDFLVDIIAKVPDAPAKAKKEQVGSESDEVKPVKRRGKKRKDSGDD